MPATAAGITAGIGAATATRPDTPSNPSTGVAKLEPPTPNNPNSTPITAPAAVTTGHDGMESLYAHSRILAPRYPGFGGDLMGAVDPNLRAELEELTTGVCRALNDPKRLLILYTLAAGPLSVGDLCEQVDLPHSNVSQHLAVLRDRGLVETERHANRVIYSLRDRRVVEAIDLLRDVMNDELTRRQALRPRVTRASSRR